MLTFQERYTRHPCRGQVHSAYYVGTSQGGVISWQRGTSGTNRNARIYLSGGMADTDSTPQAHNKVEPMLL